MCATSIDSNSTLLRGRGGGLGWVKGTSEESLISSLDGRLWLMYHRGDRHMEPSKENHIEGHMSSAGYGGWGEVCLILMLKLKLSSYKHDRNEFYKQNKRPKKHH